MNYKASILWSGRLYKLLEKLNLEEKKLEVFCEDIKSIGNLLQRTVGWCKTATVEINCRPGAHFLNVQ